MPEIPPELQAIRAQYLSQRSQYAREISELQKQMEHVRRPSFIRYYIMLYFCISADTLAWVETISVLGSGGGALLVTILLAICTSITLLVATRLLLGKRDLKKKVAKIKENIAATEKQIQRLRNNYASLLRLMRKSKRLRSTASSIQRKFQRLSTVTKSTLSLLRGTEKAVATVSAPLKAAGGTTPIIQCIPWWTIGLVFDYFDHRAEYKKFQSYAKSHGEQLRSMIEMEDAQYEASQQVLEEQQEKAA